MVLRFLSWLVVLMLLGPAGLAQPTRTVTTLAGRPKQRGAADGAGTNAQFNRPMGIAVAPDGSVYVADTDSHTLRRISPTGVVTTVAGRVGVKGSADGAGAAARFTFPVGVAVDAHGTVYVADAGNHTIRRVTPVGQVSTIAGLAGQKGRTDGAGSEARFNMPHGLAVAPDGTIYVADTENHTLRQLTPEGRVSTWAGQAGQKGSTDGERAAARFFHPTGLALDVSGTVYVVDNGNHVIRAVPAVGPVRTLAGQAGKHGSADGVGAAARFYWPNGIAVTAAGELYVADNVNATIRQITAAGIVSTVAGSAHHWGSQDGPATDAQFEFPFGIAVDTAGLVLYITDTKNHCVRRLQ